MITYVHGFTGKLVCEETNISGSNFYNQYTSAYDAELFRLFEIKEVAGKVPDIIGSADLAGFVTSGSSQPMWASRRNACFGGVLMSLVRRSLLASMTVQR